mmetsp:Transcript_13134/g.19208  ORF Transcript_13134/g.19208 Transcript_13134/m.19208 type:complete len:120 (-) Transcript_13134:223-582(-)
MRLIHHGVHMMIWVNLGRVTSHSSGSPFCNMPFSQHNLHTCIHTSPLAAWDHFLKNSTKNGSLNITGPQRKSLKELQSKDSPLEDHLFSRQLKWKRRRRLKKLQLKKRVKRHIYNESNG